MRSVIICLVVIAGIFISEAVFDQMCPMGKGQASGEEVKKKEKDIYALSYLAGYKCYRAMAGIVGMKERLNFIRGYKSGFADALMIGINESSFDAGFQDAGNRYPSRYSEDILKEKDNE